MTNPLRRPQSPQRFFLNAPKQRNVECYVLNHDYMELDAYCVTLLRQIDTLSRPAVEPTALHDGIAKIVKEAAEHIEDICPRPGPYHPAFAALVELADKVKFVPRGPDSEDEEKAWVDGVAQMVKVLNSELERLKQPEKSSAP